MIRRTKIITTTSMAAGRYVLRAFQRNGNILRITHPFSRNLRLKNHEGIGSVKIIPGKI